MSVTPIVTNDLEAMLTEYQRAARAGEVTYCIVIAQTENEEYVSWLCAEEGEISYNPDHIMHLMGILTTQTNYAADALREALND